MSNAVSFVEGSAVSPAVQGEDRIHFGLELELSWIPSGGRWSDGVLSVLGLVLTGLNQAMTI